MGIEAPERERLGWRMVIVAGCALLVAALGAWYLQITIPRHIVLASGLRDGTYHEMAQKYRAILEREGLRVEERLTAGADENMRLLRDRTSGVDVAFMQGGVARAGETGDVVMLAALYYEPLWVFYRGEATLTRIDQLRYRRIAIGVPGSGVRAFAEPLLAANGISTLNTELLPLSNIEALRALQEGRIDAMLIIGPVHSPAIWQALHDDDLKLMNLVRADAYARQFPYIDALMLPAGTVDLAQDIPPVAIQMVGTKAMLAARESVPSAIVDLLLNAAREVHGHHGFFEAAEEFPNTHPVDLPVSTDAIGHLRFGPSLLHRYLPYFLATYIERLVILLVPLLVVLVPLVNFLPQALRWRVRSRIYRWYGRLMLLEREVRDAAVPAAPERWLAELDRIERAAARIRTPPSYASEAYTLREHIALVRRAIEARGGQARAAG